jgi:hypothetical protein
MAKTIDFSVAAIIIFTYCSAPPNYTKIACNSLKTKCLGIKGMGCRTQAVSWSDGRAQEEKNCKLAEQAWQAMFKGK